MPGEEFPVILPRTSPASSPAPAPAQRVPPLAITHHRKKRSYRHDLPVLGAESPAFDRRSSGGPPAEFASVTRIRQADVADITRVSWASESAFGGYYLGSPTVQLSNSSVISQRAGLINLKGHPEIFRPQPAARHRRSHRGWRRQRRRVKIEVASASSSPPPSPTRPSRSSSWQRVGAGRRRRQRSSVMVGLQGLRSDTMIAGRPSSAIWSVAVTHWNLLKPAPDRRHGG